jgi:hypothetical protein
LDILNNIPHPAPANKFIPEWFQKSQIKTDPAGPLIRDNVSIKACPGIIDSFNQGYIIPAWCDFSISFNASRQELKLDTDWSSHFVTVFPPQMYSKINMPIEYKSVIFKLTTPWRVGTSTGVSTEIKKPVWREMNNITIYEGIVDTDTFINELHVVVSFNEDTTLTFKKGDPLLQLVPFIRDSFEMSIKNWDQEISDKYSVQQGQLNFEEISSYKKLFWQSKDYK